MSYPAYDDDRDPLAKLADDLLASAAVVSFMISELSGGDFSALTPRDQDAAHHNAYMTICDSLTELGARHRAADLATAATILNDAIGAIAENLFPRDGPGFGCEGRGHVGRSRPRHR